MNAVGEWFQRDVTEFNLHLMPLTFIGLPSDTQGSLLNAEEKEFLAFLDSIDHSADDPESVYSISVNVELKFTRSKSSDALRVQVTGDSSALPVNLTEEDIRERYPWDYATLTDRCRERYEDFKVNEPYHTIRRSLALDERFGRVRLLDPGNAKSAKKPFFNPNIMAELDKHYTKKDSG